MALSTTAAGGEMGNSVDMARESLRKRSMATPPKKSRKAYSKTVSTYLTKAILQLMTQRKT